MSKNEQNRLRLAGLVKAFDLSLADVGKVIGVSRPLVSRILSGNIEGHGIYAKLEKHLPRLIEKRRQNYFSVEGTGLENVAELVGVSTNASEPNEPNEPNDTNDAMNQPTLSALME